MATPERYTTHTKVNQLLRLPTAFTTSTTPTIKQVENLIEQKMDNIDETVRTSYHLSQSKEYHHTDGVYEPYSGYRYFLNFRNVLTPLSSSLGDSLKVWNGATWEEFVGVKTEGRANDFWIDEVLGILHIKTGYFGVKDTAIDVTYRYNSGARTQLNDANGVTNSETGDFTVDSTVGFPYQGWIRIDDEEMRYNAKTLTTLSIIERGAFNTTAATHSDNAIIYWCPKDVEEACTKMVALDLLTSEDWSSGGMNSGDMAGNQLSISGKIENWRKDVNDFFSQKRPSVVSLR